MKTGVAKSQQEQRQLGSLRAELKSLSDKIESAKKRLESYQFDQDAHTRLQELLAELSAQRDRLAPEVVRLERERKVIESQIEILNKSISAKQADLDAVTKLHGTTKEQLDTYREEIRILKLDRESLIASSKSSKVLKNSETGRQLEAASNALTQVNNLLARRQKKADDLADVEKRHDDLIGAIAEAQTAKDALDRTLKDMDAEKIKKQNALNDLDKELEEKRAAFNKECQEKEVALRLREKDLDERAGDLNRREQWHNKRSGLLRQAKSELEEIHGKPLRHIVIPPDVEDYNH
jgi:chromosome segregation ATPase